MPGGGQGRIFGTRYRNDGLIAAGSIEERIAELQQRKAALADAILEGGGSSGPRFNDADLDALLASLPGVAPKRARTRRAAGNGCLPPVIRHCGMKTNPIHGSR
jgi:hypothetical protein